MDCFFLYLLFSRVNGSCPLFPLMATLECFPTTLGDKSMAAYITFPFFKCAEWNMIKFLDWWLNKYGSCLYIPHYFSFCDFSSLVPCIVQCTYRYSLVSPQYIILSLTLCGNATMHACLYASYHAGKCSYVYLLGKLKHT